MNIKFKLACIFDNYRKVYQIIRLFLSAHPSKISYYIRKENNKKPVH